MLTSTIATSYVMFSSIADRIAAKFCMKKKKIRPNDIFQYCVHSTSTLKYIVSKRTKKLTYALFQNDYTLKCSAVVAVRGSFRK